MSASFYIEAKPRTVDLNVLFPVEVVQIIRDLAATHGVSLSVVVRKAVAIGLEEMGK